MNKLRKIGVNAPYIYFVDYDLKQIIMQYVEGIKVRDFLINQSQIEK